MTPAEILNLCIVSLLRLCKSEYILTQCEFEGVTALSLTCLLQYDRMRICQAQAF